MAKYRIKLTKEEVLELQKNRKQRFPQYTNLSGRLGKVTNARICEVLKRGKVSITSIRQGSPCRIRIRQTWSSRYFYGK